MKSIDDLVVVHELELAIKRDQSLLAALLSTLVARQWIPAWGLLMGWWGPDALAVVRSVGVCLLDFFCSGVQSYLL